MAARFSWLIVLALFSLLIKSFQTTAVVEFHFRSNSSDNALLDTEVEVGKATSFLLQASDNILDEEVNLTLLYDNGDGKNFTSQSDLLSVSVSTAFSGSGTKTTWIVNAHANDPGHVTLVLSGVTATGGDNTTYNTSKAFVRFQIYHSQPLNVLSEVIGWIYFVAWSVSFYPQVWLNWRRKSVIGLNFDFLGLNIVGFLCYTAYNVGLFFISTIQAEYTDAHPHDIVPVEVNDVVFAIHACAITIITIIQAIIYEKGDQKLSIVARVIIGICGLAILIFIIVAAVPSVTGFNWLDMLLGFSYVKLGITVVKYIPQAWMNFRRKSTVGWSIGNVLLDFAGGSCSIVQMFILAYNFNDWASIFLNPVKFWLGALSVIFDIIFMVQHYGLYRNRGAYSTLVTNGAEERS